MCPLQVDTLYCGEVGYLAAQIKSVQDARVGDTVTLKKAPAAAPLAGYQDVQVRQTAAWVQRGKQQLLSLTLGPEGQQSYNTKQNPTGNSDSCGRPQPHKASCA